MSKQQEHNDWYGTRTVIVMKNSCRFCLDGSHSKCAHEIAWYDKLWICPCSCNKSWKPVQVVVDKKKSTAN